MMLTSDLIFLFPLLAFLQNIQAFETQNGVLLELKNQTSLAGSGAFISEGKYRSVKLWIPFDFLQSAKEMKTMLPLEVSCYVLPKFGKKLVHLADTHISTWDATFVDFLMPNSAKVFFDGRQNPCVLLEMKLCRSCGAFIRCEPAIERSSDLSNIPQRSFNLAICTVIQSPGEIFKEWLTYSVLSGFKHLYIYDNLSEKSFRISEIMAPLVTKKLATVVKWPEIDGGRGFQPSAVNDCFQRFGKEVMYMAHFDVDEFLIAPGLMKNEKIVNLDVVVSNFFDTNNSISELIIVWAVFGPKREQSDKTGLTIGSHQNRLSVEQIRDTKNGFQYHRDHDNRIVYASKSIVRFAERHYCSRSPHYFSTFAETFRVSFNVLRLNHYYVISYESWVIKSKKKDMSFSQFSEDFAQFNQVSDSVLASCAEQVRQLMHLYWI